MTWNESDHPRDGAGRFTAGAVRKWAGAVNLNAVGKRRGDRRPEGFDAARRRHLALGTIIPRNRARTDDEEAELNALDEAFEAYRESLGLQERWTGDGPRYTDEQGREYSMHGRFQDGRPLLGSGWSVGRTGRFRARQWHERHEDRTGTPKGRERRDPEEGGKIGRQYEGREAPEFKAFLVRAKGRARAELERTPVRRTPRGTAVDGWMNKINDRIEKGARRG